jgi:hypothetical protein
MMAVAYLKSRLEKLLGKQLGVYRRGQQGTIPAIWSGEPPSTWQAQGLECRLAIVPSVDVTPVYMGAGLGTTFEVRLIAHGQCDIERAAKAIAQTFNTPSPQLIAQNDSLGLLAQYVFQIKG